MTDGKQRFLVVFAHPVKDSLAASLKDAVVEGLTSGGHEVDLIDLYADDFDPRMTEAERAGYADPALDRQPEIIDYGERLQAASGLVFVFPQWWLSMPAILKGFVDRVFVPGIGFDVKPDGSGYLPRLHDLRTVIVVTSAASPSWLIRIVRKDPLKQQLRGILALCARDPDLKMHCHYGLQKPDQQKIKAFVEAVRAACSRL